MTGQGSGSPPRTERAGGPRSIRSQVERALGGIPGLTARPARRGSGFEYTVGDREVAHFHGERRMDVRLGRTAIALRKSLGGFDRRVRTRGPSADWVAVELSGVDAVALVRALVAELVRRPASSGDLGRAGT
jgi:hypothetical protein